MQKSMPIAIILGALIIAAALVYHGHQLTKVSRRLQAMEQRTSELDNRLDMLSNNLPTLIAQAGNSAGRQVVHGMVEEAVQMPLRLLRPTSETGKSNALERAASLLQSGRAILDQGAPWVRFDIPKPVIKIEILPNLKEIPGLAWPSNLDIKQPISPSNNEARSESSPLTAGEEK